MKVRPAVASALVALSLGTVAVVPAVAAPSVAQVRKLERAIAQRNATIVSLREANADLGAKLADAQAQVASIGATLAGVGAQLADTEAKWKVAERARTLAVAAANAPSLISVMNPDEAWALLKPLAQRLQVPPTYRVVLTGSLGDGPPGGDTSWTETFIFNKTMILD